MNTNCFSAKKILSLSLNALINFHRLRFRSVFTSI